MVKVWFNDYVFVFIDDNGDMYTPCYDPETDASLEFNAVFIGSEDDANAKKEAVALDKDDESKFLKCWDKSGNLDNIVTIIQNVSKCDKEKAHKYVRYNDRAHRLLKKISLSDISRYGANNCYNTFKNYSGLWPDDDNRLMKYVSVLLDLDRQNRIYHVCIDYYGDEEEREKDPLKYNFKNTLVYTCGYYRRSTEDTNKMADECFEKYPDPNDYDKRLYHALGISKIQLWKTQKKRK